jgi:hypothetical protein
MSIAAAIRKAVEDRQMLVVDSKSEADYAARVAKEHGRVFYQRKLVTGGWVLRICPGVRRRRPSSMF